MTADNPTPKKHIFHKWGAYEQYPGSRLEQRRFCDVCHREQIKRVIGG